MTRFENQFFIYLLTMLSDKILSTWTDIAN